MKTSTKVLILVSVVVGIIAAAGLFVVMRLGRGAPKVDTLAVPLAKKELRQGTLIRDPEELFETKQLVRELVPPNAVLRMEDLRNRVLQRTVDAGSMVTSRDLEEAKRASPD